MATTISAYEEHLHDLESNLDASRATELRHDLSEIRQKTALLRCYVLPQREALNHLLSEPPVWIDDNLRPRLRETADRLARYLEELDAKRDRASVVKDDIANHLAETSNRTLYVLAIISDIFLPLAFLTGLMGVNIGGMPGTENEHALWIFCAFMASCLGFELVLFRILKWL